MMEDLSLHVLDIVENAIRAEATRVEIAIDEDEPRDRLTIRIADNGRGMPEADLRRARDPFFTTGAKRTGLGLPFLAQAAELSGGRLEIDSTAGRGTAVTAEFGWGHIDRQPLTKMAETIMILVFGHPGIDFRYRHRRNGRGFRFDSRKPLRGTGPGPLSDAARIGAVRQALRDGLKRIGAA